MHYRLKNCIRSYNEIWSKYLVQFIIRIVNNFVHWTSLIILELGAIKEKRFLTSSHS